MEIIKELNLNGNPQITKNGSLTFAKNIRLSLDGSFITNDEGFKIGIITSYDGTPNLKVAGVSAPLTVQTIEGNIVGYINCPNEIVILTSTHQIYRLVECEKYDELCVVPVDTAWVYSGGKIVGTYIYNVNNELIISIGESDTSYDIPLYTINLNKSTSNDAIENYSIAPTIPIANLDVNYLDNNIKIRPGLYYFFIRYKISNKEYTNWFPIGVPQYAVALDDKILIDHTYRVSTGTALATDNIRANINDLYQYAQSFNFRLEINDTYNFSKIQIGYIIQTDNAIVGRKLEEITIKNLINFTLDTTNNQEVSIDELIENAFNIYNVKGITSFDNKLYVANIKEKTNNDYPQDIKDCVEHIEVYQVLNRIEADSYVEDYATNEYKWVLTIGGNTFTFYNTNLYNFDVYIKDVENLAEVLTYSLIQWVDNRQNVLTYFGDNVKLSLTETGGIYFTNISTGNYVEGYVTYARVCNSGGGYAGKYTYSTANIRVSKIHKNVNDNKNTIRTLLPNETYAFYIHFVNKDGTYTNGYLINNTNGRTLSVESTNDNIYTWLDTDKSEQNYYTNRFLRFDLENNYNQNENVRLFRTYIGLTAGSINAYQENNILFQIGARFELNENYRCPDRFAGYFISYKKFNGFCYNGAIEDNIRDGEGNKIDGVYLIKGLDAELALSNINGSYLRLLNNKINDSTTDTTKFVSDTTYRIIESKPILSNTKVFFDENEINRVGKEGGILVYLESSSGNPANFIVNTYSSPGVNRSIDKDNFYSCLIYKKEDNIRITDNNDLISLGYVSNKDDLFYGTVRIEGYDYNYEDRPTKYYSSEYYVEDSSGTYVRSYMDEMVVYNPEYHSGYTRYNLKKGYPPPSYTTFVSEPTNATLIDISVYNKYNYNSFLTIELFIKYRDYKFHINPLYLQSGEDYVYIYKWDSTNGAWTLSKTVNADTNSNDRNIVFSRYSGLKTYLKYSNYYLQAVTFKKEPEPIAIATNDGKVIEGVYINPNNLSDLFELKSDYFYNQYKSYSNYDETLNYENVTPNMIRSSHPIRTESNENSWRKFDAGDYYLIDKKAGEITNIFAIGKYFFIHTRNTLLIAPADAKLTADNTTISVTNHKLFDVTPSELFTSDLGFGGLKYRECQILSQYGYIWYDSDHHKIFRYDNSKLEDLTAAVEEFISTYEPTHCYFNIDSRTNRIFMCFMKDGYSGGFTFAYSTLTNKFISFMDFGFDKNLHTTNKVFFSRTGIASIYKYDNTNFGLYGMLGMLDENLQPATESEAVFDILINIGPEIPKTLESIRWIHNYLDANNIDNNNYAELLPAYPMNKHTNRKYPEDKIYDLANVYLRIFNNNVDTQELSLFNDKLNRTSIKKQNGVDYDDSYKYPHYEKGVWQFNYFRDVINKIDDMYYSADGRDKSDIKPLIYGTYFVIRFKFKNSNNGGTTYNKRLKFDTISFKINNY